MDPSAPLRSQKRLFVARAHSRVCLLLLAVLSCASPAAADQRRPVPGFWQTVHVIWSRQLDGIPVGPPAFDDSNAYVAFREGRLAAASIATGTVVWTVTQSLTVPPAVLGGLLVGIKDATLVGMDAATGKERWRQALGAPSSLTPAMQPGWIAVVTAKPELILLQPKDGAVVWRLPLQAAVRAQPAGDGSHIYLGLANGSAVAVSLKTGTVQWTCKFGSEPRRLTVIGDRLVLGASDGFLFSLAADNGKIKWRWRTGGDVPGGVAADQRQVYFASLDNSLVSLGRGGGDRKWERRLASRPVAGPAIEDHAVVLANVAGEVWFYRTETGDVEETVTLPGRPIHEPHIVPWKGTTPARAILLTAGGQLFSLGSKVEPPEEPLDPIPGKLIPAEVLDSVEPPLVPMLYPPGRLLLPETLPPIPIRKPPARQSGRLQR